MKKIVLEILAACSISAAQAQDSLSTESWFKKNKVFQNLDVSVTAGTTGIGIDVADGMNVSIYPNPTSSTTTIALSGVNGDVAITVVDMNGRVVMSDSMSCEGDCVKTMEVSGLAQGAYFVRINGENVNMVKKLVVK